MENQFDRTAAKIQALLPETPSLVVIGSASFWDGESERTCIEIGAKLADIPYLTLVTGGVDGVGETVGRSFHRSRQTACKRRQVYHLLPEACRARSYGETFFAGDDMYDRREILARLSSLYVSIEGGPGTVHEASVALAQGAVVIPVGRSGGHSGELYAEMERPDWADENAWIALGTASIHPRDVAEAVKLLVMARFDMTR